MSSDSRRIDQVRFLGFFVLCVILAAALSGTGLVLFRMPVLKTWNIVSVALVSFVAGMLVMGGFVLRPYWDCLSEKRCLDVRRVADHDCWSDSGLVSVIEVSFPVVVYQATSNRVACSNFFFGSRP